MFLTMWFIILTLSAENAVTICFKRKLTPSYFDPSRFPSIMLERQMINDDEESPVLVCCGEIQKLEIKTLEKIMQILQ